MIKRSGYRIGLVLAIAPLVACAEAEIFDRVGPPSDPAVANADWPRLADVPAAPPQGVYTDAAPDPATGAEVQVDLAVEAAEAERRRAAVAGPVE